MICTIHKTLEDACIELGGRQDENLQPYGLDEAGKGDGIGYILASSLKDARQLVIETVCRGIFLVKKDEWLAASERALAKLAGAGNMEAKNET